MLTILLFSTCHTFPLPLLWITLTLVRRTRTLCTVCWCRGTWADTTQDSIRLVFTSDLYLYFIILLSDSFVLYHWYICLHFTFLLVPYFTINFSTKHFIIFQLKHPIICLVIIDSLIVLLWQLFSLFGFRVWKKERRSRPLASRIIPSDCCIVCSWMWVETRTLWKLRGDYTPKHFSVIK